MQKNGYCLYQASEMKPLSSNFYEFTVTQDIALIIINFLLQTAVYICTIKVSKFNVYLEIMINYNYRDVHKCTTLNCIWALTRLMFANVSHENLLLATIFMLA